MKISPRYIKDLKNNEIFVFGSNESGIHGAGAAKMAIKWGAKYGNPEGIQGKTYAIPTKDKSIKKTLSLEEIKVYVDRFVEYAKNNDNLVFLVTEIGCGLAGYRAKDIAPLFIDALNVENISLTERFWNHIKNLAQ